ncbi:MAG: 50S ribosomal protein L3, partial [Nitrososphaeraceae archaeon]
FSLVNGDYIIVRGSLPGVPKRLIKMRMPLRKKQKKIVEPKILEVIVRK